MGKLIDAVEAFGRTRDLRDWHGDPGLLAIQGLPSSAGLATRVRMMIEAGSTDEAVDQYLCAWIRSVVAAAPEHIRMAELQRALQAELETG